MTDTLMNSDSFNKTKITENMICIEGNEKVHSRKKVE